MPTFHHGFLRVAAASPELRVADCSFNVARILALMETAEEQDVGVLVFPELSLTGYTCADLFHQEPLLSSAKEALRAVQDATQPKKGFSGVVLVGLPLRVDDQLFNCAAVVHQENVLGVVPKSFLPNYKEFYEMRWFAPAFHARSTALALDDREVPFGTDLLFQSRDVASLIIGTEVCEDLWVPVPPSALHALRGATLLLNLSASNSIIAKADYRRDLIVGQSARCVAAYVFASCGAWESTTDLVFDGHCLIAENGKLLAESPRLQRAESLTIADVDLERLQHDRMKMHGFGENLRFLRLSEECRRIPFTLNAPTETKKSARIELRREIEAHPFVPSASAELNERCREIFQSQVIALAKRLEHVGKLQLTIGISGGLDSTLALLVTCKTMDALKTPRARISAFTLPGFGTTAHTRENARNLMSLLGVTSHSIDVRALCLEEMRALNHRPFGIELSKELTIDAFQKRLQALPAGDRDDLVFENVQARMRTSILMNSGFVIGTGDLSELALGWSTYNADHISMYNPNVSIPKTLVRFLIEWVAREEFDGDARETLLSIVETKISPELLPTGENGEIVQDTEAVIGPYELHDFFLYHFVRYGAAPAKLLFLAQQTELRRYGKKKLKQWLGVFLRRFFTSQYKRSCLPDGPKVGTISLSPRGDWRMPTDASAAVWEEALR